MFSYIRVTSENQGTIVRQRAAAIPQQSRTATGVLVQKLDKSDGIKDVAIVPEIDEEANEGNSKRAGGGVAAKRNARATAEP